MTTIGTLLNINPEKLLAELSELRSRERQIGQEKELLERVLEMRIENGEISPEWLSSTEHGLVPIGSLREQILRVMKSEPAKKKWLPKSIHTRLAAHGNTKATLSNVRVTMRRMLEDDELVRPPGSNGIFSLSPSRDS